MQGDREGNFLMEEVLNACFDYSLLEMNMKQTLVEDRSDQLNRLTAVLKRFNEYVSEHFTPFGEGLFQGTDSEVALWSEDLTGQIMTNRPN
jgi:hypothetical protein